MTIPIVSNLFNKKSKGEYLLALDIGSTEVKAAIFKAPTEFEGAKFIGLGRQRQGVTSMQFGKIHDLDAVIETANLAIEEAQLHAGQSAVQTIIGMSAGVLYAKGLRVRTHRANPDSVLGEDEFDKLAEQIEEKTLKKGQEELEQKYKTKFERLETSFTAYQMDGAKVRSPLGLGGKDLEVAVLHYFIEEGDLNHIESLAQELGLEIVSLVDAATNLAASKIEQYFNSVLIDIGGEVTEVVVVKAGKVISSEVLALGGQDFTDQIANDLKLSQDEAEAIKIDYALGHLDYERAQGVRRSIDSAVLWWIEGLVATLASMKIEGLPGVVLLAGQSRKLAEVKNALVTYPWDKQTDEYLQFSEYPKIEVLGGKYPGLQALTKIEV